MTLLDALYWATVATTTVGYGDITLQSASSRMFCIFYLVFGGIIVSVAIANLASLHVELQCKRKEFEFEAKTLTPELLAEMYGLAISMSSMRRQLVDRV